MSSLDLTIRADATPLVGAGHAMRCAALAEAWCLTGLGAVRLEGEITIPFVQQRLRALGVAQVRERTGASVLVVDCYDEGERADLAGREGVGVRVLVDDIGGSVPDGYDVVWNPNAYGSPTLYPGFGGTVIGGPDTIPLRASLPAWTGNGRAMVGVALGGGTPRAALRQALDRIAKDAGPDAFVAAGEWAPAGWLRADADMPWRTLASCGRLVTAGGSTVWEAAAVGIPVVVVRTAANQTRIVRWVAERRVPTVDALSTEELVLERQLRDELRRAAPLPMLASGSRAVALRLAQMARHQ